MFMHPALANAMDAVRRVVFSRGGAKAIAPKLTNPRTGEPMSGETLSAELNPHRKDAKFGFVEAMELSIVTGDLSILEAFAAAMGCKVVALEEGAPSRAVTFERQVCALGSETGDVMRVADDAMADGVITDNERARIVKECNDVRACVSAIESRACRINEEGKPAHVRLAAA
jgi:hypothetical protein